MMTCKELNRAQRAERSYPKPVRNNAPAWLAFFVGLVIGMVSLFLWALILMVSVKYVALLMRAGNRGEGGILALLALLMRGGSRKRAGLFVALSVVALSTQATNIFHEGRKALGHPGSFELVTQHGGERERQRGAAPQELQQR